MRQPDQQGELTRPRRPVQISCGVFRCSAHLWQAAPRYILRRMSSVGSERRFCRRVGEVMRRCTYMLIAFRPRGRCIGHWVRRRSLRRRSRHRCLKCPISWLELETGRTLIHLSHLSPFSLGFRPPSAVCVSPCPVTCVLLMNPSSNTKSSLGSNSSPNSTLTDLTPLFLLLRTAWQQLATGERMGLGWSGVNAVK